MAKKFVAGLGSRVIRNHPYTNNCSIGLARLRSINQTVLHENGPYHGHYRLLRCVAMFEVGLRRYVYDDAYPSNCSVQDEEPESIAATGARPTSKDNHRRAHQAALVVVREHGNGPLLSDALGVHDVETELIPHAPLAVGILFLYALLAQLCRGLVAVEEVCEESIVAHVAEHVHRDLPEQDEADSQRMERAHVRVAALVVQT